MAQEVHEQLDSRSLATNGGRLTGTRVFVVWDDASAITEPIQIELGANGMPQAGDAFPGENNVFAQTLSYEPIPASNNAWRVTWGYQSGEFVGLLPSEEGYLGVHVDWIAEFALFYLHNMDLNRARTSDDANMHLTASQMHYQLAEAIRARADGGPARVVTSQAAQG